MKRFALVLVLALAFTLSACHEGDWVFHLITPPAVVVEPQVEPDPTAVAIEEEEAPQVACDIKANVGSSGKIYHLPGGVYYDRVKVDISQGDFWACSEAEAIDAGFRKAQR